MCTGDKPEPVGQCRSIFAGRFDRVIADEGHKAKDKHTEAHKAIALLEAPHVWFLTATPMYNKVLDLNGYLEMLYRNEWERPSAGEQGNDGNGQEEQQSFKDLKEEYAHYSSTERDDIFRTGDPDDLPLHLLNPKTFRSFSKDGQIAADVAYCILPAILKMICIRRDRNDMVEALEEDGTTKMIRIGDAIPPYSIATVELRMTTKEQAAHDQYYFPLVRRLRKPKGSTKEANPSDGLPSVGDKTPRVDMRALRRLTHLAFSSKLERLVARTGTSNLSDDISK